MDEAAVLLRLILCVIFEKSSVLSAMRIKNTASAPTNNPSADADMNAHLYKLIARPRTRPNVSLHMGIAESRAGMLQVESDHSRTDRKVMTVERQMTGIRTVGCTWQTA